MRTYTHLARLVSILTAAALALSGCATPGQGSVGEPIAGGPVGCGLQATNQTNNTLSGALIGAGIGGVAAAITNGKGRNVASTAAVGALVGAGIGAYMDQQEANLRKDLAGSGINMARSGNSIILTLPEGILFASGKFALTPKAKQGLDRLVGSFSRFEKTTINVCGHTDNVGTKALNNKLSLDRARSVSEYLIQQGIPATRLSAVGFADDIPLADNSTAAGRATNRRVEIVLKPITN